MRTAPVKMTSFVCHSFVLMMFRQDDVAAIDVNMGCPKEYSTKVIHIAHVSGLCTVSKLIRRWERMMQYDFF